MPIRPTSPDLTEAQRLVLADIAANGCYLAAVPELAGRPGYAYTAGLQHTYGHPELIVFGLGEEVAGDLLEALVEAIAGGARFAAGQRCDGFLRGYPIGFRAVHPSRFERFLPAAVWAFPDGDRTALQVVWPDQQGRMPWDAGVREVFRACQPLLGEEARPAG
jgi:hypothetical protein